MCSRERIEARLESGTHEHTVVAAQDVLAAVAVVDVNVDQRHAVQAVGIECMANADGNVVEKAETHGCRIFGMVSWGAHATKGRRHLA